jgi:NitT/TauT family transport system substrate-binding protein
MSLRRFVVAFVVGLVIVSGLHAWLNVDWATLVNDRLPFERQRLHVAYIPVTCHLTCPVTDYIARNLRDSDLFIPTMFQAFPEIKEALISNRMQVGFLVAPLAIALRAQGVPIKVVYLGHRYGSAVVVHKQGTLRTVADLKGHVVAIPSRYSDERLILTRALRTVGLGEADLKLVEMPPPEVAGALAARAIDAFSMGEPFPSQAEMGGFGRVLFFARQYWPDYMSCVLVVREDVINTRPQAVQALIDGIAKSGVWLEEGRETREYAADFVGRYYFRQNPALLEWALTKPLDRVMYAPLRPRAADFQIVQDLMLDLKLIDRKLAFDEYVDLRFAERARQVPWRFGPTANHR